MKAVIIGTGLIGGSMAFDLRKAGVFTHVIGIDRNEGHLQQALSLGIIDSIGTDHDVAEADVVILAIPVNAMARLLPQLLDRMAPQTTVIDTGSTKASICRAVAGHANRSCFVAAHPIAGTENSGPTAALHGLFRNKTTIICEREKSSPSALVAARQIFDGLGMSIVYMEPEEHDKHVAYVSHLSHVSSFLLGQTVLDIERDEKNIFNLAGSGFSSTVRLAKSSPEMWAPIFEQNAEHLSQALLEYIMHLQRFQYHLMKRDTQAMLAIMKESNQIRRVLEGIELKTQQTQTKNR